MKQIICHVSKNAVALALSACGLAGLACTKANPAVCCVSQADCRAIGIEDEQTRLCRDGLVCVENTCVAPQCELDVDCDVDKPICEQQTCVQCRDDLDCPSMTPVCDANACRSCTADTDCPSDACDFETGMCVAETDVLYVSPSGTAAQDCSRQQPCSLAKALAAVSTTRPTVKLAPGVYNTSLVLDERVAIHGDGATILAVTTDHTLRVIDSADVQIYGLTIVNNNAAGGSYLGIYCYSNEVGVKVPKLTLDRVTIDTQGQPFLANSLCEARIRRSTIRGAKNEAHGFWAVEGSKAHFDRCRFEGGGSIASIGAQVSITNSVLHEIVASPPEPTFVTAYDGSLHISYSTIFETQVSCGTMSDSSDCASAARFGVCIDNSILNKPGSPQDTYSGTDCVLSHSIVSPQQGAVPGTNNVLDVDPRFVDPIAPDLRLRTDSPAIDAADPTMPGTVDYDGTARPQNGRSDMGAFERPAP